MSCVFVKVGGFLCILSPRFDVSLGKQTKKKWRKWFREETCARLFLKSRAAILLCFCCVWPFFLQAHALTLVNSSLGFATLVKGFGPGFRQWRPSQGLSLIYFWHSRIEVSFSNHREKEKRQEPNRK